MNVRRSSISVLAPVSMVVMTMVCPARAQAQSHLLTLGAGGGFTTQAGRTGNYLDNGGNIQVNGGLNLGPVFGLGATFMYNGMGLTRSALDRVSVPDGHSNVYTLTIEPKVKVPFVIGRAYVLAGGGWMRRTVTYTKPVLTSTLVFDPWWGYYGPALLPANQELGSFSQNAGVWDVGAGLEFNLPRTNWKVFAEARYLSGLTDQSHTNLLPITFGLRW